MSKVIKKLVIGLTGLGLSVSAATAGEWRFNNFLPETRPESAELEQFVTEVNVALDGETTLKLYSGGSLGLPNTDTMRFLPKGAVEMSLMWANYLGRDAPALSSVVVQGAIGSIEEFEKAIPTVRDIYEEEFAEWGVSSVGYVAIPMLSVSVFCRNEQVRSIEKLRTKKLRVWARDQVETFTRLGVAAQIIPQDEMYVAMKTGVVDCALYPALYAHTVSLQEVAKYASFLYPMASGPYVIGVATDRWDKTDEATKAAITTAADALWNRTNQYEDDFQNELKARGKLVEGGIVWGDDFPQEDRDIFVSSVTETWEMLAKEAGGNAPAYRKRVLEALGR
ncbi:MAG: TRAP transporter substrate-binding protein DctP [Planktomarina sp.]|jgi:TRAP-type C4-dicarboxylate transport system substrate-binding protein|nr:TRAP transporter substrate-binding protein DctP [Planktomarina sp.]MDE0969656.1 TRAP transporter substrate-binding protein DctP [Octadecabacter sp.]MDT2058024.1 TRAP transporter substrate-binding protein DctP [Planktomarina sp.]MDT2073955.1 TRAP transporter substrate-binding protein DctP [Planktomarina sp.]|tara:strand:- start:149 stop:1159 length:1011 start_codon:yes stop_codon:yes gene_type:complete